MGGSWLASEAILEIWDYFFDIVTESDNNIEKIQMSRMLTMVKWMINWGTVTLAFCHAHIK